jgi:predicted N-formylglutamate amidohydrolase
MDRPSSAARLLRPSDGPPVIAENEDGRAPILVICDHASAGVPQALADLGLDAVERARHIAYDIGALAVARHLARWFDAPLVASGFSRLVIDCNRLPSKPDAIPQVSDGTTIPGNQSLDAAQRAARVAECFTPYHVTIEACIARAPTPPAILSIHSFTPVFAGFQRPWQIGVLWNEDGRLALPLLPALAGKGVCVGDNQPYSGRDGRDYTLPAHAESRNLPHVEIEIRQDLVHEAAGQEAWATLLHDCLAPILAGLTA